MKKAVFPLLTITFIISCAVFVYIRRDAVPSYVDFIPAETTPATTRADAPDTPQSPPSAPVLVNINTADLDTLITLHGIGPAIGQRIIDFREEHGDFKTLEEILQVKGIGESVFAGIKDNITIG